MKHQKTSLAVAATSLLALGGLIGPCHAEVLAKYEFTGASAAQTSGTATSTNVTFGAFTGGSGSVGFSSSTNSIFARWNATGILAADGDTLAEAITLGNYATFTLTNTTGQTVDLTNLTFDIFFDPYTTGVETSVFVMSDVSGFTVGDELGSVTYASGTAPGPADTPDTITADLSSLANLAASDTIELRLYLVDDSDSNDHIFRVDNVTVNGNATGPDPDPPTWTASYPQADTATVDGFTARAAIAEPGVAYYVIVADGATAPSSAQVKAGDDGSDAAAIDSGSITLAAAGAENTAAITGLADSTAYDVYFVAEDDETPTPNLQTTPELVEITTLVPDITPPTWTASYPQADTATVDGFTARTAIDEPGTAYYVVVADGASAPSSAQVKAGNDGSDAAAIDSGNIILSAADTEDTAAITGLADSTAYDVYFVAEDDVDDETPTPNLQTTPELVEVTTLVPDTTAPSWTVGYPQVDGVTTSSATAHAAINEPGTAYYVVVADGATAPDSAQVKAGVDYSGVTIVDSGSVTLSAADTEDTAGITGLADSTAYDVYFVAEDDEDGATPTPNLQTTPELVEITTLVPAPTIVFYDFEAASLDNPTTEATNTSSSIVTGTGFGGSGRSGAGNFFGRGVSPTVLEDYISFTITADTGFTLNLDQLEFDYYVQQDQSPTNSFTFETRSSVDGFASAISGTYSLNPATSGAPYENAAFDLTGASFQGLSSIEFRLYANSDGAEQFNDIVRWDNITVSGSATSGGGGDTFAAWIGGFGLDPADQNFTDDPDGDNLPNGIEAFFGTNPAEPGQGLIQVSKSGNLFSFQHLEADPALSDVIGTYEWSLDLQNWFPQGTVGDTTVAISASKDDPVTGTTTVTADTSSSTTAPTKLFLRVVATQ